MLAGPQQYWQQSVNIASSSSNSSGRATHPPRVSLLVAPNPGPRLMDQGRAEACGCPSCPTMHHKPLLSQILRYARGQPQTDLSIAILVPRTVGSQQDLTRTLSMCFEGMRSYASTLLYLYTPLYTTASSWIQSHFHWGQMACLSTYLTLQSSFRMASLTWMLLGTGSDPSRVSETLISPFS